jgi:hypothetical protein
MEGKMTNASQPADSLARRLVAEVAVHARLQPNRWVMFGDIVPKLNDTIKTRVGGGYHIEQ